MDENSKKTNPSFTGFVDEFAIGMKEKGQNDNRFTQPQR
jgi:hypothetical protein